MSSDNRECEGDSQSRVHLLIHVDLAAAQLAVSAKLSSIHESAALLCKIVLEMRIAGIQRRLVRNKSRSRGSEKARRGIDREETRVGKEARRRGGEEARKRG